MKILITESQLDKVIDRYISLTIGNPFKIIKTTNHLRYGIGKDKIAYFFWNLSQKKMCISELIIESLMEVFGISTKEAVFTVEKWAKNHGGEKYSNFELSVCYRINLI